VALAGHCKVCTSLQNLERGANDLRGLAGATAIPSSLAPEKSRQITTGTSPLSFYRPDALPAAQLTASKCEWPNSTGTSSS